MLKLFVIACIISVCAAASVGVPEKNVANAELLEGAESANPQFGYGGKF